MAEETVLPSTQTEMVKAEPAGAPERGWARLRFWRSPPDQPRWARPALLGIVVLTGALYSWNIGRSGYAHYYAAAVKSMSVSWKAFFYGAFDPGASITLDKLGGAFLPQALSARIFGFHEWSLTLPQVVWGVLSVLVLYRLVRRWLGAAAGLLAAGLFAFTPIVASVFGHAMEDGALILCLLLAADAFMIAVTRARTRWLILAAVWVGVGFQMKMIEAWMVVPAFAVTYLLVAPASWRRRAGQLALTGAVLIAVSLSWVLLYTVTPAGKRPAMDATTNDNAFSMVFGYNGLDRFGLHVPGAARTDFTDPSLSTDLKLPPELERLAAPPQPEQPGEPQPVPEPAPEPASAPAAEDPPQAWHKLFGERYATQVGWLYPLALAGLAAGLVLYRRTRRTGPVWGGFVLWGLWLVTFAVVLSRMTVMHSAYLVALAPPLAALAAAGAVLSLRLYRDRRATWLLPSVLVAQLAWTAYLASGYPDFLPWLTWLSLGGAAVAAAVLIAGALRRATVAPAAVACLVAVLVLPCAWGLSAFDHKYAGSAFEAGAGPSGPVGVDLDSDTKDTLTDTQRSLYDYLLAHREGARYVAATTSWQTAGQFIVPTGERFLPMGGFSGQVPWPTLARVRQLVEAGEVRHVVLGGAGGLFTNDSELYRIVVWTATSCPLVPPAEHGGDPGLFVFRCTAGN
ncbi:ArnT family glycosyltransferase [Amycolatopsis sp. cmx-11-51]|uniref:ArnT family glycosyltransferase n=1 Tax=Amycolatopsis sp. cmx-11-51 TaxID=2785797 RepID=UPI0039E37651